MVRPILVGDSNASTDDMRRLDLEHRSLDAGYRAVAVEVRPLCQVKNLPDDVFGTIVQLPCKSRCSAVAQKKTDVTGHFKVFDHVGVLFNEPPSDAGLPFT
jgi:hypothetical protein